MSSLRVPEHSAEEHEFHKLGPKRFERLARHLHAAQPDIIEAIQWAPDGQRQYGADHVAYRKTADGIRTEVGQSKGYRSFGAAQIARAAKDFLDHLESYWREKRVDKFILFVGCVIKSGSANEETLRQVERFAELGIEFAVWDAGTIYDRLLAAPHVVRAQLGLDWYEKMFGRQAGPLTGLHQELEAGNSSALSLAVFVGQLNQARSSQLQELKRRIRRGEGAAVKGEIEETLRLESGALATGPERRADLLRLLAGLIINAEGDFALAKRHLDEADELDGQVSARQRAMLLLETIGPAEVLRHTVDEKEATRDVRAVTHLRLRRPGDAYAELEAAVAASDPKDAEPFRLAALAKLLLGSRGEAVELGRRAVAIEPDSRISQHTLAITLFNAALSPAIEPRLGDWPQPVEQPLVQSSDEAKGLLDEAAGILTSLTADQQLADAGPHRMWLIATLACMPWRRADAEALIAAEAKRYPFAPAIAAWAISRNLPLDETAAAEALDKRLAEDPKDLEALLVRVALANHRSEKDVARRVLEDGRAALEASDNADLYHYWSNVLRIERGQAPDKQILSQYPWVEFRVALDLKPKKARLKALKSLVAAAAGDDGDPRVLMAGCQVLLEERQYAVVARFASALVDRVGTGEAIGMAAYALARDGQGEAALGVLEKVDAFPGGVLPPDLERMRVECLAVTGNIVEAVQESGKLARATGAAPDIWRSIEYHVAIGALPKAVRLFERNEEVLSKPSPAHIRLANAIVHSAPDVAARITRHVAAAAPDGLVAAAYTLAAKLDLSDEQKILMPRMAKLGRRGAGGVQVISGIEEIVEIMKKRRAAMDEAWERYRLGKIPVHALAQGNGAALAQSYAGNLLNSSVKAVQEPPLHARYGREYPISDWPEDRQSVSLLIDVTALLTAEPLGLLDTVERAFGDLRIAADTVAALMEMRNELRPAQPSRMAAMRDVLALVEAKTIGVADDLPQLDAFVVRWDPSGGEQQSVLNLSKLVEAAAGSIKEGRLSVIREALGNTIAEPAVGPGPPEGADIALEHGIVVTLSEAGGLEPLSEKYRFTIEVAEVDQLRRQLEEQATLERTAQAVDRLIQRLSSGIEDGTYRFVPISDDRISDPLRRSYTHLIAALVQGESLFWVDDRFTTSVQTAELRTVTTAEVIDALHRYERLKPEQVFQSRQRLRAAGWLFLPIRGDEVAHHLRAAVSGADVLNTVDMAILTRSAAKAIEERRLLQWPDQQGFEKGARGEVPFLLQKPHELIEAIQSLWEDEEISIEAAETASAWILEQLDWSLMPMPELATLQAVDDLIAMHLAQLVTLGVQLPAQGGKTSRRRRYLNWAWLDVVEPMLRQRPGLEEPLFDAIERYILIELDEVISHRATWFVLMARVISDLPWSARQSLLARPGLQEVFELPVNGNVTVGRLSFDEEIFWRATTSVAQDAPVPIDDARGRKGEVALILGEHDRNTLRLTVGEIVEFIDDWALVMAAEGSRHEGLEVRNDLLDLGPDELALLDGELAKLEPWQRPMMAMARTQDTAAGWLSRLRANFRGRVPLRAAHLLPPNLGWFERHLRLDDASDLDAAVWKLIGDRGLDETVRRLSALPIVAPQPLREAIGRLSELQLSSMVDGLEGEPPWAVAFYAQLLLPVESVSAATRQQLAGLLQHAASEEAVSDYMLYMALARFLIVEARRQATFANRPPLNQLAAIWSAAGEMAGLFMSEEVHADRLAKWLQEMRLRPPQALVEPTWAIAGDAASPLSLTHERLQTFGCLPALATLAASEDQRSEALETAEGLLFGDSSSPRTARHTVLRSAIFTSDLLGSTVALDLNEDMASALADGALVSGDGFRTLILEALKGDPDDRACRVAWTHLRSACVDTPLPPEIAEVARPLLETVDLESLADGIGSARQLLLAVTSLAALNRWTEYAGKLDAAAKALEPAAGADTREGERLLAEIAFWRAHLEAEPIQRAQKLAERLGELAGYPCLRASIVVASGEFARCLSGGCVEPFIDLLARLRASEH